ncbi:MAG: phosphoglycerate mutase family protein [Actinomycetota bacterium]
MAAPDTIFLVRHAKAGERRTWTDDDVDRPLSKKGWRQAEAIAKRLATKGATTLHSSSYVRCMQTLEPLADHLDTKVREEPRLFEDQPFEPVLELLQEVPHGAVLCSHGDIIPAVIQALHRRGMKIETPPDWRKSSVWVLTRTKGRVTKGKVWPPAVI